MILLAAVCFLRKAMRRPPPEERQQQQEAQSPPPKKHAAYSFLRRQNHKHGSDVRRKQRLTEAALSAANAAEEPKPSPGPGKRKTVEQPPLAPLVGKRVRIRDVNSMAALNGMTGVATGTAQGGRYRVRLDVAHNGARGITLPPGNLEVEAPLLGARVRVVGLKGKAELNGRVGVADGYNSEKGRYHVLMDDTPGPAIMLKPSNVVAEGAQQPQQQQEHTQQQEEQASRPSLTRKRSGTLKITELDDIHRAAAEHDAGANRATHGEHGREEDDHLSPLKAKKKHKKHPHHARHGHHKGKSLRRSHTKRKLSTRGSSSSRRRKGSQRRKSHRHHAKPVSEMTEAEKEEARQKRREKRRKQVKHKVKKAAKTAALAAIAVNRARFEASIADRGGRSRRSSVGDLAASLRSAGLGGGGGQDASGATPPGSRPRLRRNSSASKLEMLRLSATKGPAAAELTQAAKKLEDLQRARTQKRLEKQQKKQKKKRGGAGKAAAAAASADP